MLVGPCVIVRASVSWLSKRLWITPATIYVLVLPELAAIVIENASATDEDFSIGSLILLFLFLVELNLFLKIVGPLLRP